MTGRQIAILAILIGYMVINAIAGVWFSHLSAKKNAEKFSALSALPEDEQ